MKNIILIKSYPNFNIAHLYEHLVLRAINEYMYSNGIFKFIDYFAQGTSYSRGGIIVTDCLFYTNKALKHQNIIKDLKISLDNKYSNLDIALQQMQAEENSFIRIDNPAQVISSINDINNTSWINIDDLNYIDTNNVKGSQKYLYELKSDKNISQKIKIRFKLDTDFAKQNRNLLPLFYYVSQAFLASICDKISYKYGAYHSNEITLNAKCDESSTELLINTENAKNIVVKELSDLIINTVSYLQNKGALERLAEVLSGVDYEDISIIPPNYDNVLSNTNIIVGSKGWKNISNIKYLEEIVKKLELELIFKRKNITIKL